MRHWAGAWTANEQGEPMLLRRHEPLGDAPRGYWRHLAANWPQNLLLALLGALGVTIAWWTDSHRLVRLFFLTMGGMGLLQLAMGVCVVLWRSPRPRGGSVP